MAEAAAAPRFVLAPSTHQHHSHRKGVRGGSGGAACQHLWCQPPVGVHGQEHRVAGWDSQRAHSWEGTAWKAPDAGARSANVCVVCEAFTASKPSAWLVRHRTHRGLSMPPRLVDRTPVSSSSLDRLKSEIVSHRGERVGACKHADCWHLSGTVRDDAIRVPPDAAHLPPCSATRRLPVGWGSSGRCSGAGLSEKEMWRVATEQC